MADLWIKLLICAFLIVIFGFKLSEYAQRIVKMGRFSEGLMGVFVLAAITSFPEAWTSIATVTTIDAPDMGIGGLIGSVVFNLMIIVALDFKFGKKPILSEISKYHDITCGFSLLTIGLVIAALSFNIFAETSKGIFNVGLGSIMIFFAYLFCMILNFKNMGSTEPQVHSDGKEFRKNLLYLIACAALIIACGFWLATLGKEIVDINGWDEMYFGTIVIALTTSLPEIVVCLAAVSIGSPNMAIANILGSNLFNMFIIPVIDIIYRKGHILSYISSSHIYSAVMAVILTLIVFAGILYKPKRSFLRLGAGTILMIIVFLTGNFYLYHSITSR